MVERVKKVLKEIKNKKIVNIKLNNIEDITVDFIWRNPKYELSSYKNNRGEIEKLVLQHSGDISQFSS